MWFIGSRTQWNISKTFYMGVDVLYENLKSATDWWCEWLYDQHDLRYRWLRFGFGEQRGEQ